VKRLGDTAVGKLFRTTVFKLSLVYLVVFAGFSVLILVYVAWQATRLIEQQTAATVNAEIAGLAEQYRSGGIRQLGAAIEERSRAPGSSLYLLTNFAGETIAGNVGAVSAGALMRPGMREIAYQRVGQDAVAIHPALVQVLALPGNYRLLVGRDLGERERLRAVMLSAMGWSLILIVLAGTAGGVLIARRVLRRIEQMSATSRTIMAGDLSGRLAVTAANDEFDRLAAATNAMLDRISELMAGLKEVSDNIAHDLKTPLTRLRNRAEEALRPGRTEDQRREALEAVIAESDDLIATFNALLVIARAESGAARELMAPVDLGELVRGVADLYEPLAEEHGGSLSVGVEPGLTAVGSRELLGQALANLVDNALKYGAGSEGQPAEVRIALEGDADGVRIVVADRGPGIAAEDRGRALDRFVRLEASRSRPGSGLGLALAAAVARLHGGTLELEDNAPGLRAVLRIPHHDTPAPALPGLPTRGDAGAVPLPWREGAREAGG
jgi:signal transduction histidine kinase